MALKRCPELTGGIYIEGWAVVGSRFLVCEHGWCEVNETIVDPTYYFTVDEPLVYFPVLRATLDQIAIVRGYEPLMWQWYGWGKPKTDESRAVNERYTQAHQSALSYVKAHYRVDTH